MATVRKTTIRTIKIAPDWHANYLPESSPCFPSSRYCAQWRSEAERACACQGTHSSRQTATSVLCGGTTQKHDTGKQVVHQPRGPTCMRGGPGSCQDVVLRSQEVPRPFLTCDYSLSNTVPLDTDTDHEDTSLSSQLAGRRQQSQGEGARSF